MPISDDDLTKQFAKQVAEGKKDVPSEEAAVSKGINHIRTAVKRVSKLDRKQATRWAIKVAELAAELGSVLPGIYSTPTTAILQTIGAGTVIHKHLFAKTNDPISEYALKHGMDKRDNNTFVRLFFNTELHTKFSIFTVKVGDNLSLYDAQGQLGRFAFVKSDYSDHYNSTYYMQRETSMPKVINGLWKQYDGRIHATFIPAPWGQGTFEFAGFENFDSPLFGKISQQMDQLVARHSRCREQKIPRSYLCYGKPGTGKSSFATKFASKLGERTLKLGATSLQSVGVKDIGALLEHLAPEFLIIDDVDKIQTGNALPTLLEIVQRFKDGDGKATLIMTSNEVKSFDQGFFRPNRIDTWLEFALPNSDERKEVINAYASHFKVRLDDHDISVLTELSNGLSQDYLREIVSEYNQSGSFSETTTLVRLMTKLLTEVNKAKTK